MTIRALRSIVRICQGGYGSPPGPYWCSQCSREIQQGERYTAEVYQYTTTEDRDAGELFCRDCREIPVPDEFSDLTDSEDGKAAARAAIDNLFRRR